MDKFQKKKAEKVQISAKDIKYLQNNLDYTYIESYLILKENKGDIQVVLNKFIEA